jgi:glycosyltransferase involved in cell wall biosynthesis
LRNIYFSYVLQKNFSGQARATEQIIESIDSDLFNTIILKQYSFDRKINKVLSFFLWSSRTFSVFPKVLRMLFDRNAFLHLSLGQEWASLIRVIWWYAPVVYFTKIKIIISLNGRNFQDWSENSKLRKLFIWVISKARIITVVGNIQKDCLNINFGIKNNKIEIIPNTSDFESITHGFIESKFKQPKHLQLMFLSLLIESKGFKLFLDALVLLVREYKFDIPIKAYICGTISFTKYCSYFSNSEEKVRDYINNTILTIQNISKIRNISFELIWIEGVRGIEKEDLFKKTHLFVLPTFFPTESQPLVLLEAMSSGCSIISSNVGEIKHILEDNVDYLYKPDVYELAQLIYENIINNKKMKDQAVLNLHNYNSKFSSKIYTDKWNNLLKSLL